MTDLEFTRGGGGDLKEEEEGKEVPAVLIV